MSKRGDEKYGSPWKTNPPSIGRRRSLTLFPIEPTVRLYYSFYMSIHFLQLFSTCTSWCFGMLENLMTKIFLNLFEFPSNFLDNRIINQLSSELLFALLNCIYPDIKPRFAISLWFFVIFYSFHFRSLNTEPTSTLLNDKSPHLCACDFTCLLFCSFPNCLISDPLSLL